VETGAAGREGGGAPTAAAPQVFPKRRSERAKLRTRKYAHVKRHAGRVKHLAAGGASPTRKRFEIISLESAIWLAFACGVDCAPPRPLSTHSLSQCVFPTVSPPRLFLLCLSPRVSPTVTLSPCLSHCVSPRVSPTVFPSQCLSHCVSPSVSLPVSLPL
jgi:hypothetical protein